MIIRYKNKPTKDLLDSYCRKIEDFLEAHKVNMSVELFEIPGVSEFSFNGVLNEKECIWIDKIIINSQATGKIEVKINRDGIDENISDYEIWNDACYIQEQIYRHLKIEPNIEDRNDPYWNLWKKHPDNAE